MCMMCCRVQGNSQDVRVWFLTLTVGSEYPKEPPTINFTSKVNMDCVDSKGNVRLSRLAAACQLCTPCTRYLPQVVPSKLPYLAEWTADCSMKGALQAVQAALRSAPKSQPSDESTY